MTNETIFTLIGTDEDENALFLCSFCENFITLDSYGSNDIEIFRMGDTCPECGAKILRIDLD